MIFKVCPVCGKEFRAKQNRNIYCSRTCANESRRRYPKIKQCPTCNKVFENNKHPRAIYCSKKCSQEAKRAANKLTCAYCGKSFYKAPSQVKYYKKTYCSNECRYLDKRKTDKIYYEENYAYILLEKDNIVKKILFDIEDIEKISHYKWHLHLRKRDMRYDVCTNTYGKHTDRKYINMPRYLLDYNGDNTVDHINRNTLDNRRCNLRIVSIYENNLNKNINTSGHVGVVWDKARNKWYASFKNKYLGRFDNFEDAVLARKKAESYHLQNRH